MDKYRQLLDEEIWSFIERVNSYKPAAGAALAEQREAYNRLSLGLRAPVIPDHLSIVDQPISGVDARFYGDPTDTRLVYLHGGGFVVGDLESHHDICAELAQSTGKQLVAVDYRLSPENAHPAAYQDALRVAGFILASGANFILVGDSAGATLAAALSSELRHERQLIGQVLIYPALGGDVNKGSYLEHAHAPLLTREEVLYYLNVRGGDPADPTLNPLAGDCRDLPPTLIFACECDPLRDDGAAYAAKIIAHGGQAKNVIQAGLPHGHLRARHSSKVARQAFEDICDGIVLLSARSAKLWEDGPGFPSELASS